MEFEHKPDTKRANDLNRPDHWGTPGHQANESGYWQDDHQWQDVPLDWGLSDDNRSQTLQVDNALNPMGNPYDSDRRWAQDTGGPGARTDNRDVRSDQPSSSITMSRATGDGAQNEREVWEGICANQGRSERGPRSVPECALVQLRRNGPLGAAGELGMQFGALKDELTDLCGNVRDSADRWDPVLTAYAAGFELARERLATAVEDSDRHQRQLFMGVLSVVSVGAISFVSSVAQLRAGLRGSELLINTTEDAVQSAVEVSLSALTNPDQVQTETGLGMLAQLKADCVEHKDAIIQSLQLVLDGVRAATRQSFIDITTADEEDVAADTDRWAPIFRTCAELTEGMAQQVLSSRLLDEPPEASEALLADDMERMLWQRWVAENVDPGEQYVHCTQGIPGDCDTTTVGQTHLGYPIRARWRALGIPLEHQRALNWAAGYATPMLPFDEVSTSDEEPGS